MSIGIKQRIKKVLRIFPNFRVTDNTYEMTKQLVDENKVLKDSIVQLENYVNNDLLKVLKMELDQVVKIQQSSLEMHANHLREQNLEHQQITLENIKIYLEGLMNAQQKTNIAIGEIKQVYEDEIAKMDEIKNMNYWINQGVNNIQHTAWEIQSNTKQLSATNVELIPLRVNEVLDSKNKLKVLIVGFYGAPNMGDELMLHVLIEKIRARANIDITIMLCDNVKYNCEKWNGVSILHLPKTRSDINVLVKAFDYIIWGGGAMLDDSLSKDKEAYKSHIPVILRELSMAALRNNKKVMLVGVSSNDIIEDKSYIADLKYIIDNAYYCSVRDEKSKQTLINLGINADNVEVTHDIVFALDCKHCIEEEKPEKVLGLVLISDQDRGKIKLIIEEAIEYIKTSEEKWKIKFIPFYTYMECDINYINELIKEIDFQETTYEVLDEIILIDELINEFLSCDFMICMRYHATLLCLKLGIPSINIVYDIHRHYPNKMGWLKECYNQHKYFINYTEIVKNSIMQKLDFLTYDEYKLKEEMKRISQIIEMEANEQLSRTLQCISE